MSHDKFFFPNNTYYNPRSFLSVSSQLSPLDRGEDPKKLLLEFCKPGCTYWKEKLERCEEKLKSIIKINPTKTCMYPMRDYVTCIEACVRPASLTCVGPAEDPQQFNRN